MLDTGNGLGVAQRFKGCGLERGLRKRCPAYQNWQLLGSRWSLSLSQLQSPAYVPRHGQDAECRAARVKTRRQEVVQTQELDVDTSSGELCRRTSDILHPVWANTIAIYAPQPAVLGFVGHKGADAGRICRSEERMEVFSIWQQKQAAKGLL